jgi:hypothetical protein
MLNNTDDAADPEFFLMPTLEIHAANPLLDVDPRTRLWIGLSAIYSIPLKACLIIFGRIPIHIRI